MAADFQTLGDYQRSLRSQATKGENALCRILNEAGIEYIFQETIGYYIVDFVIPSRMMIIEVDGASHDSEEARAYDKRRDDWLRQRGFKVQRVKDAHVGDYLVREINLHREYKPDVFREALKRATAKKIEEGMADHTELTDEEILKSLRRHLDAWPLASVLKAKLVRSLTNQALEGAKRGLAVIRRPERQKQKELARKMAKEIAAKAQADARKPRLIKADTFRERMDAFRRQTEG